MPIGTDNYSAPFNIVNYNKVNVPYYSASPQAAIYLNNVGNITSGIYDGIIIGTPGVSTYNSEQCLIDGYTFGINATNTNLKVHNCTFNEITNFSYPYTTAGINSQSTGGQYNLDVEPGVSGSITSPNLFYNCSIGVNSSNYYHITCNGNKFITNHGVGSSTFPAGSSAYNIQSSAYDNVEFNNNTITNVTNGINFVSTLAPGHYVSFGGGFGYTTAPSQYAGNITANGNTIQYSLPGDSRPGLNANFGIALQNVVNNYGPPYFFASVTPAGNIQTSNNNMTHVNHGILTSCYWMQPVIANNNTILVTGLNTRTYGINHIDCYNNTISNNNIGGAMPMNPGENQYSDSARAYIVSNSSQSTVNCNNENQIGRGFEFENLNPGMVWENSFMTGQNQSLQKGMVLNYSIIGTQGTPGSTSLGWDNISFGGFPAETYVITSSTSPSTYDAFQSKIFTTPLSIPAPNRSNPSTWDYSTLLGALVSASSVIPPCGQPGTGGGHSSDMFVSIATGGIPFAAADPGVWLSQYMAYQSVIADSNLIKNSPVMAAFYNLAQGSRYAYLAALESAIVIGDYNTADSLFNNPLPALGDVQDQRTGVWVQDDDRADYIVQNYINFYGVYEDYSTGSMTNQDSLMIPQIAAECPNLFGPVVYRARGLYTAVFGLLTDWNDDYCGAQLDSVIQNNARKGNYENNTGANLKTQVYRLMPNPNNGSFVLNQLYPDMKPVKVEILNSLGELTYQNSVNFTGGSCNISLNNFVPGLYLIKLTDTEGKNYNIKFILQ